MPKTNGATLKQKRFAKAYVMEGNATEAVFQAGYKVKNRNVAKAMASENLAKPVVQAEIQSWQQFLEAETLPSLQTIRELRNTSEDGRIRLAASRDLLNRAGVGKQNEAPRSVITVFANMDEAKLLERMAQLAGSKNANASKEEVSPNIQCATQQDGVEGSSTPAAK